jgi:hypothetical protein
LRRLVQELDAFPYLTEQDKQIAACIRRASDSYYGGSEFEINIDKALPFLVAPLPCTGRCAGCSH